MHFWYDLFHCNFDFTAKYFRSMGWKVKTLLKMTFGKWDDDMMRGFQIKEKAKLFALLSMDHLQLPVFNQVFRNLEHMAASNAKFEVEAVLCEHINLIGK